MPKKLDDVFQVTIDRINRQAPAKSNQGMQVLKWTYLAARPLSIIELRHAIATADKASDNNTLDLNDLPFEKSLIGCCYSLVVVDKETSTIRLVHKSLQDFLKMRHESRKLFQTGDNDIARTCLTYMCLKDNTVANNPGTISEIVDDLNSRSILSSTSSKVTLSSHIIRFPLIMYAIDFWGEHVRRKEDPAIIDLFVQWLLREQAHDCISRNLRLRVLNKFTGHYPYQGCIDREEMSDLTRFPGLHIAAYYGTIGLAKTLLSESASLGINATSRTKTALSICSYEGHKSFTDWLLERDDIKAELESSRKYSTELLAAADGNGWTEIVRLLIMKGAEVNSGTTSGNPLWCAYRST